MQNAIDTLRAAVAKRRASGAELSLQQALHIKEYMVACDIAWAAGIFEGEGTIIRAKTNKGASPWHASVSSTDKCVIDKLYAIFGMGKVYGPYGYVNGKSRRREHHKEYWRWVVHTKETVTAVFMLIYPYLSDRRHGKFKLAIEEMKTLKSRQPRGKMITRPSLRPEHA